MKNVLIYLNCLFLLLVAGCSEEITDVEIENFTWKTSTPEAEGMNAQILDSAMIKAEQLGFVDCVLIIRNSLIVAERYYNGYNESIPHNTWSVSKSFLSAITGIALNRGHLPGLGKKVLDYFPEYVTPGMDQRKHNITIEHLLTMKMGIDGERVNYMQVYNSDNWLKTTLELPLIFSPGEGYSYNAYVTHVLSGVITKATGKNTKEYAQQYLTNPMGITLGDWEQDPQGYYFGGNSMHFTPRDMAMLGYLYLNNGRMNNKQIVPEEWVGFTLTPSTNWGNNQWGAMKNYNYGYLWWLSQLNDYNAFMAFGYAGQLVITLPDINVIIVTTANSNVGWDESGEQELAILNIVGNYILEAL
jgi:CubicO group peptidase (beta-lactamase class C family)